MARSGDRHRDCGEDLEHLGVRDDLGLDPGRGEDQIHDHPKAVHIGADQAHSCEPAHRVLLHEGTEVVAICVQRADQLLGGGIAFDEYGHVDVTGEPRSWPIRRNPRPVPTWPAENPAQRRSGGAPLRPGSQSPCSAPDRRRSHAAISVSMSCALASGHSRRSARCGTSAGSAIPVPNRPGRLSQILSWFARRYCRGSRGVLLDRAFAHGGCRRRGASPPRGLGTGWVTVPSTKVTDSSEGATWRRDVSQQNSRPSNVSGFIERISGCAIPRTRWKR